jgi:protein TonB
LKQNRASLDSLVQISFLIDIDGKLKEYRVIRDPGYDTGITLVDLLRKIGKWEPAIYKGNPVPVRFTLPIKLPTTNRKP